MKWMFAVVMVTAMGCKHKPPAPISDARPPVVMAEGQERAVAELKANFSKVHFPYDQATLDSVGKAALEANAKILQSYPQLKVEVQGHADERGTVDYNLALGQRRANSVVNYLTAQGVTATRLPVVSYGEERPATSGKSETVFAQNRRAEFRILSGSPNVTGTTKD